MPMTCDYGERGLEFVSRILNENSLRLSRTRKGVSDTSTSERKLPLRLSGEALKARSAENELATHRLLMELRRRPEPAGPETIEAWLFAIADRTNDGLLPAGRFREWTIADKLLPEAVPGAVRDFCAALQARWDELAADPVPLAAWAEWELNGGVIHPFYDGCGRISRSFAALLLMRGSCLLPLFDNLASYFEHGGQGDAAFCAYYRERIAACAEWLGEARA
jgi:hypothetical protein